MKLPPLFNPSNDMALAANVRQYFPPRRIQQMEDDLAALARLWDEGPWGWSLATRQRYRRMGVPAEALPDEAWLAEVRRLSSREFGVEYYRKLCDSLRDDRLIPCRARFCQTAEEAEEALLAAKGTAIAKAPWSSSGRGNVVIDRADDDWARRRIAGIIREQGGVVVEPFYAGKTVDFAMEFQVGDGNREGEGERVRFLGYSVFEADEAGRYGGNYVESQEELRRRIDLPGELLDSLVDYHKRRLAILPYRGPVGIDMMKTADGRVHPCVELNFRMTMGLLALFLYHKGIRQDQLLTPERTHGFVSAVSHGRLCIIHHP